MSGHPAAFDDLVALLLTCALKGTFLLLIVGFFAFSTTAANRRHFLWFCSLALLLLIPFVDPWVPKLAWLPNLGPLGAGSVQATEGLAAFLERHWSLIVWIWLAGCAFFLVRLLLGIGSLFLIRRQSAVIDDPDWGDLLAECKSYIGIRKKVLLLEHPRSRMPMTWGFFRSFIVLPSAANTWNRARARAVLLHELAHVRRKDFLLKIVRDVVCTLYWFHPLVWLAAFEMEEDTEEASDDAVLSAGQKPVTYAEHLASVATSQDLGNPADSRLTVGLARKPLLVRLRSILNPTKARYPLTKIDRFKMISGACCVALLTVVIGFRDQLIPPVDKVRSAFDAVTPSLFDQESEPNDFLAIFSVDRSKGAWERVARSGLSKLVEKAGASVSGKSTLSETANEDWEIFLADAATGETDSLVLNPGGQLLASTLVIPGELSRQPTIDVPEVSDPQPLIPEESEPEEPIEGEGPAPGLDQIGDILPYLENILWGPDPGSESSDSPSGNDFGLAGIGNSGGQFQVSASLISAPQPIEVIRANAERSASTAKASVDNPITTAPRQSSDIQRIAVDSEKPDAASGTPRIEEQVKASIRIEPGTVLVKGKHHLAVTFWRTVDRKTPLQVQASNDLLEWHSNPQLFYLANVGGEENRQEVTIGLRASMAESHFKYMRVREQFVVDVPAAPAAE